METASLDMSGRFHISHLPCIGSVGWRGGAYSGIGLPSPRQGGGGAVYSRTLHADISDLPSSWCAWDMSDEQRAV